jgi:hypothetical protein
MHAENIFLFGIDVILLYAIIYEWESVHRVQSKSRNVHTTRVHVVIIPRMFMHCMYERLIVLLIFFWKHKIRENCVNNWEITYKMHRIKNHQTEGQNSSYKPKSKNKKKNLFMVWAFRILTAHSYKSFSISSLIF